MSIANAQSNCNIVRCRTQGRLLFLNKTLLTIQILRGVLITKEGCITIQGWVSKLKVQIKVNKCDKVNKK